MPLGVAPLTKQEKGLKTQLRRWRLKIEGTQADLIGKDLRTKDLKSNMPMISKTMSHIVFTKKFSIWRRKIPFWTRPQDIVHIADVYLMWTTWPVTTWCPSHEAVPANSTTYCQLAERATSKRAMIRWTPSVCGFSGTPCIRRISWRTTQWWKPYQRNGSTLRAIDWRSPLWRGLLLNCRSHLYFWYWRWWASLYWLTFFHFFWGWENVNGIIYRKFF